MPGVISDHFGYLSTRERRPCCDSRTLGISAPQHRSGGLPWHMSGAEPAETPEKPVDEQQGEALEHEEEDHEHEEDVASESDSSEAESEGGEGSAAKKKKKKKKVMAGPLHSGGTLNAGAWPNLRALWVKAPTNACTNTQLSQPSAA